MKIEFRFNGESALVLTPETDREKNLIRMFREGNISVEMSPTGIAPEAIQFIAREGAGKITVHKEGKPLKHIHDIHIDYGKEDVKDFLANEEMAEIDARSRETYREPQK